MDSEPEQRQQWTGSHLMLSALLQLLLVHIAYRIDRSKAVPYISTSAYAIVFGIAFGALLAFLSKRRMSDAGLDPQLLFFALLPPIILDAGFNTQRKGFFTNFGAICLLALLGTLIATVVTGGALLWLGNHGVLETVLTPSEAFLYGSLISAIDPVSTLVVLKKSYVPPLLFNLLFGESVINDAVAIVVFGLFQDSVLEEDIAPLTWHSAFEIVTHLIAIGVGSVALSTMICLASAFLLKRSDVAMKQYPTYETSIILLSAYVSYVAGESLHLSGLLAVFFSGVWIRHYHMYNISETSATTFKHLLSTLAFLSENFIYIYLGVSVLAYSELFEWDWSFIRASVGVCLVARALNTFPLCALANVCRSEPIPISYMVVIWFAGLRGAIAFALALNIRTCGKPSERSHSAILRAATLFTVLFTTILLGMATGPLLRILHLDHSESDRDNHRNQQQQRPHDVVDEETPLRQVRRDMEDESSSTVSATLFKWSSIHDLWVALDEAHLKPTFGGKPRRTGDSS